MGINKKGMTTLGLLLIIFVALAIIIIMVVLSYAMGIVDNVFSQIDFTIGNNSFNETYQETLQPGLLIMETTFPAIISTGVLLGMVIGLVIVGYSVKKMNRLWILVDIFIIIVAEILAVIIRDSFVSFISSNPAFLSIAQTTLSGGAKYIVNLPIIIPTIGVLVMLATYFLTKEKEESDFEAIE